MSTHRPFFSLVIPTLNEAKYLPLLLKDLANQTWQDFEVFVVDAHSEDATIKKATTWTKKLHLQILFSDVRNAGHQRNIGAKKASGHWIVFLDADDRLPDFFLVGLTYGLAKKPNVDIFSCWEDILSYPPSDRPLMYLANATKELMAKVSPFAPGALLGIRRELFTRYQFNPEMIVAEDHDLISRVVKDGGTFHIFREPRYVFSLRRFKKEGTLKLLRTYAKMYLKFLSGNKMNESMPEYPMLGGSLYQNNSLKEISHFPRETVRRRIEEIKAFLNDLSS